MADRDHDRARACVRLGCTARPTGRACARRQPRVDESARARACEGSDRSEEGRQHAALRREGSSVARPRGSPVREAPSRVVPFGDGEARRRAHQGQGRARRRHPQQRRGSPALRAGPRHRAAPPHCAHQDDAAGRVVGRARHVRRPSGPPRALQAAHRSRSRRPRHRRRAHAEGRPLSLQRSHHAGRGRREDDRDRPQADERHAERGRLPPERDDLRREARVRRAQVEQADRPHRARCLGVHRLHRGSRLLARHQRGHLIAHRRLARRRVVPDRLRQRGVARHRVDGIARLQRDAPRGRRERRLQGRPDRSSASTATCRASRTTSRRRSAARPPSSSTTSSSRRASATTSRTTASASATRRSSSSSAT